MNKLKSLLVAGGLAALALSGCDELRAAGADGFSCETKKNQGIRISDHYSILYATKGKQKVIVTYFNDRKELEIYNLGYKEAIDAVLACENAIENLPAEKEE